MEERRKEQEKLEVSPLGGGGELSQTEPPEWDMVGSGFIPWGMLQCLVPPLPAPGKPG